MRQGSHGPLKEDSQWQILAPLLASGAWGACGFRSLVVGAWCGYLIWKVIELIRPLNRTPIGWDEIDRFELITSPGLVDRGSRRVAIKRRRHGIIPRSQMQIPTLWITDRTKGPFSRLKGRPHSRPPPARTSRT